MRSVSSYRRDFRTINCARNVKLYLFNNSYNLSMSFLRPQEFQESPKFHDKKFDLEDYMEWYSLNQSSYYNCFTYPHDWRGFNVSGYTVYNWWKSNNNISNREFSLFGKFINKCINDFGSAKILNMYFIGLLDNKSNRDVLNHELTHAIWNTCTEYKDKTLMVILNEMHPNDVMHMESWLLLKGYSQNVLFDEINAYMVTGGIKGLNCHKMKGYKKLKKLYTEYVKPISEKVYFSDEK